MSLHEIVQVGMVILSSKFQIKEDTDRASTTKRDLREERHRSAIAKAISYLVVLRATRRQSASFACVSYFMAISRKSCLDVLALLVISNSASDDIYSLVNMQRYNIKNYRYIIIYFMYTNQLLH